MKQSILGLLALAFTGCATQQGGSTGNDDLVSSSGYTLRDGNLYDLDDSLVPRIFYFALDSFKVADKYQPHLQAHAKFIATEPQVVVKVEGHGDERGSREYNLALGERRAYSISNILKGHGVPETRIRSYGEERPVVSGSDESAWQKNRRVEIIY